MIPSPPKQKEFNIAGPCFQGRHYMLDPVNRLPIAKSLAKSGEYFVIHAPRQSGKTTLLKKITAEINT
jgi:predicted AAA+ superfamily ATPase